MPFRTTAGSQVVMAVGLTLTGDTAELGQEGL